MELEVLQSIRLSSKIKVLFLSHALQQMNSPERMISTIEVSQVIMNGHVIEDYPEDPRGHSCLLLGYGENQRPIHVVCSPKNDYLAIITAYLPDKNKWSEDFKNRKK
jgi:hypothetical protein